MSSRRLRVNFRRNKEFQRKRNPCPTPTGLCPTTTDYYFAILHVFKKTAYGWKEFARADRRLHQMWALFTHSGYSVFSCGFLALQHRFKGTPRTWKPPEKTKNSILMDLPPLVPQALCSDPKGVRTQGVSPSRTPCFASGLSVVPTSCCHFLL